MIKSTTQHQFLIIIYYYKYNMEGSFHSDHIKLIQEHLRDVPAQFIRKFCVQIGIFDHQSYLYLQFFQNLLHLYRLKLRKMWQFEPITQEIMGSARRIDQGFYNALKILYSKKQFRNALEKQIQQRMPSNFQSNNTESSLEKFLFPSSLAKNNLSPPSLYQKGKSNLNLKVIDDFACRDPFSSAKSPLCIEITRNEVKPQNKMTNIENPFNSYITQQSINLMDSLQCLCGRQPRSIDHQKQKAKCFRCYHCEEYYHYDCMKRSPSNKNCVFCHLKLMVPVKKVVSTLFVGVMKKGFKKHDLKFIMPDLLRENESVQVRCFRLKQSIQNAVLFPDIANFSLNNDPYKQIQPLTRMSCLKYRKDQPFQLSRWQLKLNQVNLLGVSEKAALNKEKDIRNEPQNHLIGIYVVQNLKINQTVEEIAEESAFTYEQSQDIIRSGFQVDNEFQELSCQLMKIPLTCTLSTQKIAIPVRGVFCRHFQCFDLRNYIMLISQAQNPRWKCPICNMNAYQLKVDIVLEAILKECKEMEQVKEMLIFKNGEFSLMIGDEPDKQRRHINQLDIHKRIKRKRHEDNNEIKEEPKPRKRQPFIIPKDAQIIELD